MGLLHPIPQSVYAISYNLALASQADTIGKYVYGEISVVRNIDALSYMHKTASNVIQIFFTILR